MRTAAGDIKNGQCLVAAALKEALEISVMGTEGVPASSILSLCAGSMKRQRPLAQCSEPFNFSTNDGRNGCPLRVDVLSPLATSGQQYAISPGDHKLLLTPENGKLLSGAAGTPMSITLRVNGSSANQSPSSTSSEILRGYIEKHDLMRKLTSAMKLCFRQLPEDPLKFIAEELSPARDPPNSASSAPPPAHRSAAGDSLHVLPMCVRKSQITTRFLDFGSGETGFYSYWNDTEGRLQVKSNKRKAAFFAHYVELCNVDAFCDAVLEEFELASPSTSLGTQLAVFCGATGLNRDKLMCKTSVQATQDFLKQAEHTLAQRLGIPSVRLRLFVPSGIVEAQLELRATEWLVGRTNILEKLGEGDPEADMGSIMLLKEALLKLDRDCDGEVSKEEVVQRLSEMQAKQGDIAVALPEFLTNLNISGEGTFDVSEYSSILSTLKQSRSLQAMVQRAAFSGTVSAGGGSCQMAMMGSNGGDGALQLFSVAIGNRVPIVEGLFSKPVLPEEREHWRSRIRSELSHAHIPRKTRGFFVGISAAFHAMKAANLADKMITKRAAVSGLEATLEKLPSDDQRSIANLTLISELLNWVFHDDANFLFKRNWKFDEMEYTACWTLGLYTQQIKTVLQTKGQEKWKTAKRRVTVPISMQHMLKEGSCADSLLEVPFVAWPMSPSHLLDFGSGEIGIYKFEADLKTVKVRSLVSKKVEKPIYEGFVKDSLVDEFAELMMSEFGLLEDSLDLRGDQAEVIAGGATGLHRDLLLGDHLKRDSMLRFFADVEQAMERKLGRRMTIRLFVPSGELEAQFELRAVVWLIGQPDVDVGSGKLCDWLIENAFRVLSAVDGEDDMSSEEAQIALASLGVSQRESKVLFDRADTDMNSCIDHDEFFKAVQADPLLQALVRRTAFCGTISAGGGSSQLSLTSGGGSLGMSQLYSMPIGNRVPIVTGMFSTAATSDEKAMWVERIRDSLHNSGYPQGLTGLFVGISATYHAAKLAGIADRIVSKPEAAAAFASALAKVEDTDHRGLANLTLTKELINWAFDDERSCFLFKRNWYANGCNHVAGWTLGWYVTQFEGDAEVREHCVCNMQKLVRDKRARIQPELVKSQSAGI